MQSDAITFNVDGMEPATQKSLGERYKPLPPLERLDVLFEVRDGSLFNRVGRPRAKKGTEAGAVNLLTGYRLVCVDYSKYKVHRVIWAMVNRSDPGQLVVDHIDGNKLHNHPSNLRLLSKSMNALNAKRFGHNTSGVTGVCWYSREARWVAKGRHNGRRQVLGYFHRKEDAIQARKDWEASLWQQ